MESKMAMVNSKVAPYSSKVVGLIVSSMTEKYNLKEMSTTQKLMYMKAQSKIINLMVKASTFSIAIATTQDNSKMAYFMEREKSHMKMVIIMMVSSNMG